MISRTATKAVEHLHRNPRCRIIALSASEHHARVLASEVVRLAEEANRDDPTTFGVITINGERYVQCQPLYTGRSFTSAFLGSRTLGLRADVLLLAADFDYYAHDTRAQQKLVSWIRCSLFTRLTHPSEIADDYSSISTQSLYELTKMPVMSCLYEALGPELRRLILLLRCFPKSQP